MENAINIKGFHGTSQELSQSIIQQGFKSSGCSEWFGEGVYFFETYSTLTDGFIEARDWARIVKGFSRWSVIFSTIKTIDYIDLVDNIEHKKIYDRIKEKMLEIHAKSGQNIDNFTETTIFLEMQRSLDVDVIRCLVDSMKNRGYYSFVVRRPQVQVCVKNVQCIFGISIYREGVYEQRH